MERTSSDNPLQRMDEALNHWREEIATAAQLQADRYWEHHLQLDRTGSSDTPSSLGCRIRQKGDGVYMEWYVNRWRKKLDGGFQPLSQHLTKPGRSFSYAIKKLCQNAPAWEHAMIRRTEAVFANLRQQNHQLAQLRRNLRKLTALAENFDELENEGGLD